MKTFVSNALLTAVAAVTCVVRAVKGKLLHSDKPVLGQHFVMRGSFNCAGLDEPMWESSYEISSWQVLCQEDESKLPSLWDFPAVCEHCPWRN